MGEDDIKRGQIWIYKSKGTEYIIEHVGDMKLLDGPWITAITYVDNLTGAIYTRDASTFFQRFDQKISEHKAAN